MKFNKTIKMMTALMILGAVISVQQYQIIKLDNRVTELDAQSKVAGDHMQVMSEIYFNDVQALQKEVDYLQTQNDIQGVALEAQSEMLINYDHHVSDLEHELNAYELALEDAAPMFQLPTTWDGPILTKEIGGNMGPAGRETYYNLPMQGCINKMRSLGYSEEEYPYWVRDDGAKMFGRYVMIAANWKIRPLGTVLETSLGWSIVVDTGDFVADYPYGVDIAVDW